MRIDQALNTLRTTNGWTHRELARQLGVRPETVWRWERGRAVPRGRRLRVLATLTGLPTTALQPEAGARRRPGRSLERTALRIAQALETWIAERG